MKDSLFVLLLALLVFVCLVETGASYTIERDYKWSYRGEIWTWTLYIDSQAYQFYKQFPRVWDLSVYVTTPYDDPFLASLIHAFRQGAEKAGLDEWDTINLVIAFVQSLQYVPDSVSTGHDDYPRYPIETLVDNGGDCEDTSILTASLLKQMGYDVVLLRYPTHVAVGVAGNDMIQGVYYEYNGRKYFYLETTGEGWTIGQIPSFLRQKAAEIILLVPKPALMFSWHSKVWDWNYIEVVYKVKVIVTNYGSTTAFETYCYASLDSKQEGHVWDDEKVGPFDLSPLGKESCTFYLEAPLREWMRLSIYIWSSNHAVISDHSKWFKP